MSREAFLLAHGYRVREHSEARHPPQGSSNATNHPHESSPLTLDEDTRLAIPSYSTRKTNPNPRLDPGSSHQLRPAPPDHVQNGLSHMELRTAQMTQLVNRMRFIEKQYNHERKYYEELHYRVAHGLVGMTRGAEAEYQHRIEQDKSSSIPQSYNDTIDAGASHTPSSSPNSQRPSQFSQGFLEESDGKWVRAFQRFESYISLKLSGHRLDYWLTEQFKCYVACSMICSYEMARTAV